MNAGWYRRRWTVCYIYVVAPAAMPLPAWQLQLHSIASGPAIVPYDLLAARCCGGIVSSIVFDVEYLLLHGVDRNRRQHITDARLLYYGFKWHNYCLARWQCRWFYHSACQMEQTDPQGVSMVAAAVALQQRWICCTWGCLVSLRCQLRPILYYNQLQWIPNGRRKMKRKKLGRRIGGSGVALLSIQMFQL